MSGRCLVTVFGAEYLRRVIFIADTRHSPITNWDRNTPPASAPPPLNTSPSLGQRIRAATWSWGIRDKLSETLDDLKSMSLDESTSGHWSIYNGDSRLSDAVVDNGRCTVDEFSTIASTEETDLPIDWRSDSDDADVEGVLLFDDDNYENECQCDEMATSMVDKSLQVTHQSMPHEDGSLDDMHSDEGCCKCGCGGVGENLSEALDDLKSMSLDESTSGHWSIYNGDDCCTVGEVSTVANTEETDLPFDWRSDGDDAINYENGSQCDDVVTSIVDKCLQVSL